MDSMRLNEAEIREKVLRIELGARKILNQNLSGGYRSSFQGHGIEFDQVREYQDGDEQRMIDWNVTARSGHPYVKKFIEERENSVLIALDVSASQNFGSEEYLKSEISAEFAAVVSMIAQKNNDKLGLFLFAEDFTYYRRPAKGKKGSQQIIFEILDSVGKGRGTNLSASFNTLMKMIQKKSLIFLISDFIESADADFKFELSRLNRRHHLVCAFTGDKAEEEMPAAGLIRIKDLETGMTMAVDTDSKLWREKYKQMNRLRTERVEEIFGKNGIDYLKLSPNKDYRGDLLRIFNKKTRVF